MVYKNKIKIFIIIISFLFLSSYISAEPCSLSSPQITSDKAQLFNIGCDSSNQNCYFALISSPQSNNINDFGECTSSCNDGNVTCYESCADEFLNSNYLSFSNTLEISKNSCEDKNTTLILTSNINFGITGQNYDGNFSFGDILRTNGHDITIEVNNNSTPVNNNLNMHTQFKFKETSKIILNEDSSIKMIEEKRDHQACSLPSEERKYGVSLYLGDLVVEENDANVSKILVKADVVDDNPNVCPHNDDYEKIISGGSSQLYFESIVNYGNLNIDIIAANGNMGYVWSNANDCKHGGNGGKGGFVNLEASSNFNKIINYSNLNLNLKSGKGGLGAKGMSPKGNGRCVGSGGLGGDSGDINFNISDIKNYSVDSNLNISLISQNAGNGGNSGWDKGGSGQPAHGGNGGLSGDINFNNSKINIYNEGNFDLNVTAGNGGNGGVKHNHCDADDGANKSYPGNGGDGGTVNKIVIDNITNASESMFNLNVISGKKGLMTETKEACIRDAIDGSYGRLYDLNIDYLDNKSKNIEIKMISEDNLENSTCDNYNYSNININFLQTKSYLPKTLYTVNKNKNKSISYNSDCRQINIIGCYVNTASNIDYFTDELNLSVTNNLDMDEIFKNQLNLNSKNIEYKYCPYCDIIDLDNSAFRISQEYSLYSDKGGTIKENDLNIYYAYDSANWNPANWNPSYLDFNGVFKINVKNKELPIYTNIKDITSVYDDDLGLYEYKITKDKLKWNYYPDYSFKENDYLYCAGQPYILRGTLVVPSQSQQYFKIPFTPIFKISNTW